VPDGQSALEKGLNGCPQVILRHNAGKIRGGQKRWLCYDFFMNSNDDIARFFSSKAFGVVGASNDPAKYGNRVLKGYLRQGLAAYPVNPNEEIVEGLKSYESVKDLPKDVTSISVITPPEITEHVVREVLETGIRNIWMQPGAESPRAIAMSQTGGRNVIADGSCILVAFSTDPRFRRS
jgi:uncharacterized protein